VRLLSVVFESLICEPSRQASRSDEWWMSEQIL